MNIIFRTIRFLGVIGLLIPTIAAAAVPSFSISGIKEIKPTEALVEVLYDSGGVEYAITSAPKIAISYTDLSDGLTAATSFISESPGSRATLFRMSPLKPNTTYSFRAVMQYDGQRYATAEQRLTTKSLPASEIIESTSTTAQSAIVPISLFPSTTVTASTVGATKTVNAVESIVKTGGSGNKNGVALAITDSRARVTEGQTFEYTVQYHNANTRPLRSARIVIQLPEQYTFDAGDGNTVYSNTDNIVTIYLGTIAAEDSGTITFKARALGTEDVGVVTKAVLVYTGGSVSAVDRDTYAGGAKSVLGATVFGSRFFPQTFFGWLLVIVILVILMVIARRYLTPVQKTEAK